MSQKDNIYDKIKIQKEKFNSLKNTTNYDRVIFT